MLKKIIRIFLALLIAALVAAAVAVCVLLFAGGTTIKTAVNTAGPQLLGAPVTLKDAELHPFSGRARLRELRVGNPEGFNTPSLLEVADVDVELSTLSLFTDTIHIRRIYIEAPKITYEKGPGSSNIRTIQDHLNGTKDARPTTSSTNQPPSEKTQTEKKKGAKAERKVIIDEIVIVKPQLNASHTALGGNYMAVKLGQIELHDIGKEKGGIPVSEAVKEVSAAISHSVEEAVGKVVGAVKDAAKEIKRNAAPLIDQLKGIFGGNKDKKKKDAPADETK